MKIRMLKEAVVQKLYDKVPENLELYRNSNFDDILDDNATYFEGNLDIDIDQLNKIKIEGSDLRDAENSVLMYNAIKTSNLAVMRDSRLWTYLYHADLLEYTRLRWSISKDDEVAIKEIRTHFFCRTARDVERNNAASRLWWMAYLCSRVKTVSMEDAISAMLFRSDVRASIVERPTTSQNLTVLDAVVSALSESYKSDRQLFVRNTWRAVMKDLNLKGGVTLLASLPEPAVRGIIHQCVLNTNG